MPLPERRWSRRVLILWVCLAVVDASRLLAQEAGGTILIRGTRPDNVYAAGGTIDVLADLEKDLLAAGGTLTIRQLVNGDVTVAGGSVTISGQVHDDVRAAGGTLIIGAAVGGELVAAGGQVTLAPEGSVSGRAWLSGGRVEVSGTVGRELSVAAGAVTIGGQIGGDVLLVAKDIAVLPTARIQGNLSYTSPSEAKIDPAAHIVGAITPHRAEPPVAQGKRIARLVWAVVRGAIVLGLIVAGLVLVWLFPDFTSAAAGTVARAPWRSAGLGFALLVATPVAALLLSITIVGLPLGLAVLALYGVSLLCGCLTAAIFVGDLGARWGRREAGLARGRRVLFLALALILLALLSLIPIVGGVILFVALICGLGAWSYQAYRRYAGERAVSQG